MMRIHPEIRDAIDELKANLADGDTGNDEVRDSALQLVAALEGSAPAQPRAERAGGPIKPAAGTVVYLSEDDGAHLVCDGCGEPVRTNEAHRCDDDPE